MTTDNTSTEAAQPEERVRPWGSLAHRDFALLWTSSLFSGMSRYMREMLNYFLIYEISGSAIQLGLTGIFQAIPVLVLGLISGSLADSVDRKKMLVVMHTLGLITPFALFALVYTDNIAVWHLWLLTSVTSTVGVMSGPAQRAFIPRLVPRSHLMNAV
ncbi:MAG: MFS transporter, partial [Dehalococcoidia bacterium]